jgi:hypothetical protein
LLLLLLLLDDDDDDIVVLKCCCGNAQWSFFVTQLHSSEAELQSQQAALKALKDQLAAQQHAESKSHEVTFFLDDSPLYMVSIDSAHPETRASEPRGRLAAKAPRRQVS